MSNLSRRRPNKIALGLVATLTTAVVVSLATFGELGYAASSLTHAARTAAQVVVPRMSTHATSASAPLSSAAAQYGQKVTICAVTPNGKQHTISISQDAEASYLATHPDAYTGSCGAFRPRGVTANVCIKLSKNQYAAVFVPAGRLNAYLKRNAGSHKTKTGRC
jgi:hypothetical protein